MLLTLNYCIEKKLPLDHVLTTEDKAALIEENKDKEYSYFCLMKEMFLYQTTVAGLFQGWSGVKLFRM